jgi:hypothetical protein
MFFFFLWKIENKKKKKKKAFSFLFFKQYRMNSQNEEQVIPNEQVFKTTSVALIEKLLQFPTPRLDSKIVNVLLLEGNS